MRKNSLLSINNEGYEMTIKISKWVAESLSSESLIALQRDCLDLASRIDSLSKHPIEVADNKDDTPQAKTNTQANTQTNTQAQTNTTASTAKKGGEKISD